MDWIDTGIRTAAENMELDRALLEDLEGQEEILLHFYEWERPSATYGHFIKPEDFVREGVLDLARRPTGGGIVFHVTDFAFSVLVPSHLASDNTLENYAFINKKVIEALGEGELLPQEPKGLDVACKSFCMAKPTIYDVMLKGKKVGGAAQRRTKAGFLHQGTIFLQNMPPTLLEAILLPKTRVHEAMSSNSYALAPDVPLEEARAQIKQRLLEVFQG